MLLLQILDAFNDRHVAILQRSYKKNHYTTLYYIYVKISGKFLRQIKHNLISNTDKRNTKNTSLVSADLNIENNRKSV